MKVWKMSVSVEKSTIGVFPAPFRVVHVEAEQRVDQVDIWFEVDPDSEEEVRRTFKVFGTGHDISDGWEHVGSTVVVPYVWHVYEWKGDG